MSVRIRTTRDLSHFSENARAQIKEKAPDALSVKKQQTRILTTHEGLKYCPFPSKDPGVTLHKALISEFGSIFIHKDGEIAHEVLIAGTENAFRYDYMHVRSRVAIEFDGFGSHRDKASFQRDREKDIQAGRRGYLVYRTTNKAVRNNVETIIREIKEIITQRPFYKDRIELVGKTFVRVHKEEGNSE